MVERIVVFDVLGPMYHYDTKGWKGGAVGPLLNKLRKHGYEIDTAVKEAEAEETMLLTKQEIPLIMPGFVESVLYLRGEGVTPVVVSAGMPWTLEYTLELAAEDYHERTGIFVAPEKIVLPENLISTVLLGSKKVSQTWTTAVERFGDVPVLAVYEDTFKNLEAALEGFDAAVGYHVTSTRSGLSLIEHEREIVRGHMKELHWYLQELVAQV